LNGYGGFRDPCTPAQAAAKATQVRIMKSVNRSILTIWLALIASVCITVPSSAQKGDVTARSAQIAELGRAGKYSEAIPLAQRLLADQRDGALESAGR
jgi:hypothetical protein